MTSWTEQEFREAVEASSSFVAVFKKLGLTVKGTGGYRTVRKYCALYGLSTEHFKGRAGAALLASLTRTRPLAELLVNGSDIPSSKLKGRLYAAGLKKRECEFCGQGEIWRGSRMALRLDHINGDSKDNRLGNLRILCPNCDATLPTFCRGKAGISSCPVCEKPKKPGNKFCSGCKHSNRPRTPEELAFYVRKRKTEWPPEEELRKLVQELGKEAVGRKYGVSGNAVKKWLLFYDSSKC